jgi:DeoR/GlpR family transcriptional regulator of sugar metabolism
MAISKVVRGRRSMTFAELQAVIPASPATIRKDLRELAKSGELVRGRMAA